MRFAPELDARFRAAGAAARALSTPRWANRGPHVRRPLFRRARDPAARARLWEVSERETGVTFGLGSP